jgi:hypothetical protein
MSFHYEMFEKLIDHVNKNNYIDRIEFNLVAGSIEPYIFIIYLNLNNSDIADYIKLKETTINFKIDMKSSIQEKNLLNLDEKLISVFRTCFDLGGYNLLLWPDHVYNICLKHSVTYSVNNKEWKFVPLYDYI